MPKEVREEIRKEYNHTYGWSWDSVKNAFMETLYGSHNLTSDTEPEEMLMVERKKVVEWYSSLSNEHKIYAKGTTDRISLGARLAMIEELFGDKCRQDNPNTPNSGELKSQEADNKPRFKVGDKVIHNHKNREVGEVAAYFPDEKFCYSVRFGKEYHNMAEHQLEPYTEPETKDMEEKELGKEDNFPAKELNHKALYDALCELESASIKVRKALIRYEVEITD